MEEYERSEALRILKETIRIRTSGAADSPRERQGEMHHYLYEGISDYAGSARLAEGPTGIGKSYTYLSIAAAEALRGKRTLISTEFIKLQSQLIEDFDLVEQATQSLGYRRPTMAVYKGMGNYVCRSTVPEEIAAVWKILEREKVFIAEDAGVDEFEVHLRSTDDLGHLVPTNFTGAKRDEFEERLRLLQWSLDSTAGDASGDKADYVGGVYESDIDARFDRVSASGQECVGKKCHFFDNCFGVAARTRAAAADVVVTNHSMLGVQAAHNVPAVVGNKQIGDFDLLVVDEAHSLTRIVRDQSERTMSLGGLARTVAQAQSAVGRYRDSLIIGASPGDRETLDDLTERTTFLIEHFRTVVAPALAQSLWDMAGGKVLMPIRGSSRFYPKTSYDEKHRLGPDCNLGDAAGAFKREVSNPLREILDTVIESTGAGSNRQRAVRAHSSLMSAVRLMDTIKKADGKSSVVAWLSYEEKLSTPGDPGGSITKQGIKLPPEIHLEHVERIAVNAIRVDVSNETLSNLWRHPAPSEGEVDTGAAMEDAEGGRPEDPDPIPRFDRQVILVSGTLPRDARDELGLDRHDPSAPEQLALDNPNFKDAESRSRLIFASFDPPLHARYTMTVKATGKTAKNLTDAQWVDLECADLIPRLARANGGRTLVLTATKPAGKEYVKRIKAQNRGMPVYSQWGPLGTNGEADAWREDPRPSVLVGTKSYMTGLDAAGDTCTLVIVDRAPRGPNTAISEARKGRNSSNPYVEDSVVLLRQALGRLIRSEGDRGMVVFLDPRFTKPTGEYAAMRRLIVSRTSQHYQVDNVEWSRLEAAVRQNGKASDAHFRSLAST